MVLYLMKNTDEEEASKTASSEPPAHFSVHRLGAFSASQPLELRACAYSDFGTSFALSLRPAAGPQEREKGGLAADQHGSATSNCQAVSGGGGGA